MKWTIVVFWPDYARDRLGNFQTFVVKALSKSDAVVRVRSVARDWAEAHEEPVNDESDIVIAAVFLGHFANHYNGE